MNRREFFRHVAQIIPLAMGAFALPVVLPFFGAGLSSVMLHSQSLNKSIQGTRDGRILESLDGGKTWQTIAKFSSHCAVIALREDQNQIYAQIRVEGHAFLLTSWTGREWRTLERAS